MSRDMQDLEDMANAEAIVLKLERIKFQKQLLSGVRWTFLTALLMVMIYGHEQNITFRETLFIVPAFILWASFTSCVLSERT